MEFSSSLVHRVPLIWRFVNESSNTSRGYGRSSCCEARRFAIDLSFPALNFRKPWILHKRSSTPHYQSRWMIWQIGSRERQLLLLISCQLPLNHTGGGERGPREETPQRN